MIIRLHVRSASALMGGADAVMLRFGGNFCKPTAPASVNAGWSSPNTGQLVSSISS